MKPTKTVSYTGNTTTSDWFQQYHRYRAIAQTQRWHSLLLGLIIGLLILSLWL